MPFTTNFYDITTNCLIRGSRLGPATTTAQALGDPAVLISVASRILAGVTSLLNGFGFPCSLGAQARVWRGVVNAQLIASTRVRVVET